MEEFFKTLFSGWADWGIAEWGFVLTVLSYLGLDGSSGFKRARYVLRGFRPEPETVQKIEVVETKKAPEPLPPVRFGLPHLERQVRGRERELEYLRAGLVETGEAAIVNSGAVLQGQGGIGKTTLARYYVERFGDRYGGIVWAVAENEGALAQTLMGLAPQLDVSLDNLPPVQAAQAVLAKLAQDERDWLVIYDNVSEFDTIRNLIPDCHLIVTTRSTAGWDGFATLQADVLDYATEEGAAVRVLMEAAKRDDDAAGARDLAEDLGGLPLALVVAGALIKSEGYGFAAYRERIADVIAEVPKNAAYPDSVIGAVKLSYDALTEDAQMVADILAWWAPEGLTPDLLTGAPKGARWNHDRFMVSEDVIALVSDASRVRVAFQALVDASLLTRLGTAEGPHEMHRMTGAALRALQGGRVGPRLSATALLAAVCPTDVNASSEFPRFRRLTPHVLALWQACDARYVRALRHGVDAQPVEAMGWLLGQTGVFLQNVEDFKEGLALAEASFEIAQSRLPESHLSYVAGLQNLALARLGGGDSVGAARAMARAVALDEKHRPESEELASSYNEVGRILTEMTEAGQLERLPEAVRYSQRGLELRRRLHGWQSEPVASSLNNLAKARALQGRGAAAMRLASASLRIWRNVLPEGDARIAYGVMNKGAFLVQDGRADEAEPLLTEALDIRRAVYVSEPQHSDLYVTADWLISCLLVRAAAGENRGKREMQARQLAEEFGFDWKQCVEKAKQYSYRPDARDG